MRPWESVAAFTGSGGEPEVLPGPGASGCSGRRSAAEKRGIAFPHVAGRQRAFRQATGGHNRGIGVPDTVVLSSFAPRVGQAAPAQPARRRQRALATTLAIMIGIDVAGHARRIAKVLADAKQLSTAEEFFRPSDCPKSPLDEATLKKPSVGAQPGDMIGFPGRDGEKSARQPTSVCHRPSHHPAPESL
jgi:hypothetical protein